MAKSADAFRTISEVADILDTPAHVLRFWETRFVQIRPIKRSGGRRYYRPADVALLSGIKHLLHIQGMPIRNVQRLLKDNGVSHVMAYADTSRVFADRTPPPTSRPVAFNGFVLAKQLCSLQISSLDINERTKLTAARDGLLLLHQRLLNLPDKHA